MNDDLPSGPWLTEPIAHIDAHLRWMRRRGMADSTLVARRRALTLMAEHLGHDPVTATVDELEDWQDALSTPGVTRHQTHLVRPYYRWLQARGHRDDNPAELLATPRRPRRLPRPIGEPDLLRAVELAPTRELPWLLLAGWCGMRASDIARMRRDQVVVDVHGDRWIRIAGKGDVVRDVPVPGWVWSVIDPLMAPDGWCWRRQRGPGAGENPPTAQHISQYCNEFLHRVGIAETLHSLRHRAASLVLDDTASLRLVQDLLGHAGLGTVQDYTRVRSTDVAQAVERLPRPAGVPAPPARRSRAGAPPPAVAAGLGMRDHWVAGFLAGQRSTETRDAYGGDLRQYFGWADRRQVDVFCVGRAGVDAYRDWLSVATHDPGPGRPRIRYRPSTVARKLGALWSWYQYLVDEHLLVDNPCARVRRPRVSDESTTRALARDDARALLAEAARCGPVEHAAVGLMLIAALRVSEVCALDVADVGEDAGRPVVDVTRKGGRRQRIAIPAGLRDVLDDVVAARGRTPSKALLLRGGARVRPHQLADLVARLARTAGISGRVTPHVLRHTAATSAFDAGADVRAVQELLGHRYVNTTQRYDRARSRLERSAAYRLGDLFA